MRRRSLVPSLVFLLVAFAACGDDPAVDFEAAADAAAADATSSSPTSDDAGAAATPATDAAATTKPTDAAADAAPVPTFSGEATYYAADGTGACGFAATTNLMVAAMNKAQYQKSVCGKCVRVKGPKGEVTVRIVDLCPGCKQGDLDLSEEAFTQVAALSAGRVKISWSFVTCP